MNHFNLFKNLFSTDLKFIEQVEWFAKSNFVSLFEKVITVAEMNIPEVYSLRSGYKSLVC